MSTRIILVRHGETQYNRELVFRGQQDIPLNDKGHLQAELTAKALRDYGISAIYSSPLSRAVDTASPLADFLEIDVRIMPQIDDADFGTWQGLPVQQVEQSHPELYAQWQQRPWEVQFPGGESYAQVSRRSSEALKGIAGQHGSETIALFSHRFVLKVLICNAIGLDKGFWNVFLATGSISEIRYDEQEKFVLAGLNNTSHLKSAAAPGKIDF